LSAAQLGKTAAWAMHGCRRLVPVRRGRAASGWPPTGWPDGPAKAAITGLRSSWRSPRAHRRSAWSGSSAGVRARSGLSTVWRRAGGPGPGDPGRLAGRRLAYPRAWRRSGGVQGRPRLPSVSADRGQVRLSPSRGRQQRRRGDQHGSRRLALHHRSGRARRSPSGPPADRAGPGGWSSGRSNGMGNLHDADVNPLSGDQQSPPL